VSVVKASDGQRVPMIEMPDPTRSRFNGPELRRRRREKGIDVTRFAASIGRSNFSLFRYESGAGAPPIEVLVEMVRLLDCQPVDLFDPIGD
jgi:predicted transcriptional regulator